MAPTKLVQAALFVTSIAVFGLGIYEIRIERKDLKQYLWFKDAIMYWPRQPPNQGKYDLYMDPAGMDLTVDHAILACGALAIVSGILGATYVIACMNLKSSSHLRYLSLAPSIIGSISTAVCIAVFGAATAKYYNSSKWHFTDPYSSGMHFTKESWMCQMRSVVDWQYPDEICNRSRKVRYILIPIFVLLGIHSALATVETLRHFLRRDSVEEEAKVEIEEQSVGVEQK